MFDQVDNMLKPGDLYVHKFIIGAGNGWAPDTC